MTKAYNKNKMRTLFAVLCTIIITFTAVFAPAGEVYAKTKDYVGSGYCTVLLKDSLYKKRGLQYGKVKLKISPNQTVKVVMYDLNNRFICSFKTKNATLKLGDDHNGYKIYVKDDGSPYRPKKVGAKWAITKSSNIKSIY